MRPVGWLMCCGLAASSLSACQSTSGSGDSVWEAMGKGALAGIQEGLTGQEQPNPYLSGGSAPPQGTPEQNPSSQADLSALASRYGQKDAGLIVQGHIDIGMNPEEVTLAWGEPNGKKPKSRTQEVWNYGDDKVVFTKDRVSAIRH